MKKKIIIGIIALLTIVLGVSTFIFITHKNQAKDNGQEVNGNQTESESSTENPTESSTEVKDISCFDKNSKFENTYVSFCVNESGSVYAHVNDRQKEILLDYMNSKKTIVGDFSKIEGMKLDLNYKAQVADDAIVGQEYSGKFIVLSETGLLYMYDTYELIFSKKTKLIFKYELPEKIVSYVNCDYNRESFIIGESCMISVKVVSGTEYMLFDFPIEGFEQMYATKTAYNEYVREANKKLQEYQKQIDSAE